MPLTHVTLDDKRYTIKEMKELVASRSNRLRYTPELLESMLATRQERDYVSTTSLTAKCRRQQSIMRQYDYTEDLDGMWASFRGTMFHGQLEKQAIFFGDAFEEARFFVTIDGNRLSGSPDLVTTGGILYDYKFCKEVPRWNTPWPDHCLQGQINRWLVDHADSVHWRGWAFYADNAPAALPGKKQGDIGAITCPQDFRPMDWQDLVVVYMDDKGVKPITVTKSIDIPKVGGVGTKKARVSDIWDNETAEAHIREQYALAHDALTLLNIPPAPEGWEHQSHVLCGYCAVRSECAALERDGL